MSPIRRQKRYRVDGKGRTFSAPGRHPPKPPAPPPHLSFQGSGKRRIRRRAVKGRGLSIFKVMANMANRTRTKGRGASIKGRGGTIKGRGFFDNIQHWIVKTGLKASILPGLQRALHPTVTKKGWKHSRPMQLIPREVWRAAGVKKAALDKFEYAHK